MEAWREELYRNQLYHHGILGMRWGQRNGPPYPLSSSDHSAAERKAGWQKSLSSGSTSRKEAKGYKKALNQVAKVNSKNAARLVRLSDEGEKIRNKAKKIKEGSRAYQKNVEKMDKNMTSFAGAMNAYVTGRQIADRLVAQATQKGYAVSSKSINRNAYNGKRVAGFLLGGMIGLKSVDNFASGKYQETHYSVKK